MLEKGYNLIETADLLGVKIRTIRSWIAKGTLKANKIEGSRRWVVLESEIKRMRKEDAENDYES